jgi:acetolactate synthase small subunit
MFYVYELPIPLFKKNEFFNKIIKNVGLLICTTTEYDTLKKELQITKSVTNLQEREKLLAQINAYVAKIYDISKEELEYILSTFPIVQEEIKSKVLEEFNKL